MSIRKLLLLVAALVIGVAASVRCYLDGEQTLRAETQPRVQPEAVPEALDEAQPFDAFPVRWEGPAARPQARKSEPARPPPMAAGVGARGAPKAAEASSRHPWSTCQKTKASCDAPAAPAAPPAAAGAFAPDPGAM